MKLKKPLIIIAIVIAALAVAFLGVKATLESGLKEMANTAIDEMDLGQVTDGDYPGSFSAFPVSVKLSVKVRDHRISAIDLIEHTNGQGKPAEALLAKVVETQKVDQDVVSGATCSSKAILLAISNALGK